MYRTRGCAVVRTVSHWILTSEAWVRSKVIAGEIYGNITTLEQEFLTVFGLPFSVPFHQYSVLIYSFIPDDIQA
jgi:hypothetical protein